ncbi:HPP family protein [Aquabacterium sp.]|uniref:HPP family protein n=1 Tax=Aquabacterium sp. TaxID=1872578 RepID=UPI0035C6A2C7
MTASLPPSHHAHAAPGWVHRARALLWPASTLPSRKERLRAAFGAGIGLLITAVVCHALGPAGPANLWLMAPLGASAVLVFAVPAGPMAQPWAALGGNTLSSLIGLGLAFSGIDVQWAGPLAVCLAMACMLALRCLHPPGGAVALTAVLTHTTHWTFPIFPVFTNTLLLVCAGAVYNSLTGRPYPHPQGAPGSGRRDLGTGPAEPDALSEVLRRYNQVLDVSRDDLEALLHETERLAYRERLSALRCSNIMSAPPITVQFGTPLQEAWNLLAQHDIKALPVVDRYQHLVGIVTRADFMRHAQDGAQRTGNEVRAMAERLRALLRPTPGTDSDKAEVVGQIMTRQVRVASADRALIDLLPLFTEGGHHHIPIVSEDRKLVGILTQSDFLRAWSRAVHDGWRQG